MTAPNVAQGIESLVLGAIEMHREQAVPSLTDMGVDVVDIDAFARQLAHGGDRLAARFYTRRERDFCAADADRLATTLAGKEAVAKALRTGVRGGVRWTEIEILREPSGAPYVVLTGSAAARASDQGVGRIALTLCHEPPAAVAVAVALRVEATG
jgi:holo-[acyl-carrier protein] synthase